MPIPIFCSNCSGKFTAPDGSSGKKTKCPKCGNNLVVPSPKAIAPQEVKAVIRAAEPLRGPIGATTSYYVNPEPPVLPTIREFKDCDFCGEEVLAKAKKCKHCGETLDLVLRAAEEAKRHANRRESSITMIQENTWRPVYYVTPFNHGIHLVLDILTCGAWFPIHLICWACH